MLPHKTIRMKIKVTIEAGLVVGRWQECESRDMSSPCSSDLVTCYLLSVTERCLPVSFTPGVCEHQIRACVRKHLAWTYLKVFHSFASSTFSGNVNK
jgi:hypothetical protein